MTPEEVVVLARYVHALCPAQKIDAYTPDAWIDVFAAVPQFSLDDCREGAARVAARQPFVAPAEIIAEVRKIREARLADFQYEPRLGETGGESILRRRAQVVACADGTRPAVLAITGRPRPELAQGLDSIGVMPDSDEPARPPGRYATPCPKCEARVGQPCRTPHGRTRNTPHAERKTAVRRETAPLRDARAALSALTPEQREALLAEIGVA